MSGSSDVICRNAPLGPTEVGANATCTFTEPPTGIVVGSDGVLTNWNCPASAPVIWMSLTVRPADPWFWIAIVLGLLGAPPCTSLKIKRPGDVATSPAPDPCSIGRSKRDALGAELGHVEVAVATCPR